MRFWFDLGVDGFRIDVAHGLVKAEGLPDLGSAAAAAASGGGSRSSTRTGTGTRSTRSTGRGARSPTAYDDPRVFVAEAWVAQPGAAGALRPPRRAAHRLQLRLPAGAVAGRADLRASIDRRSLSAHEAVGAPPTWVLSNHDTVREVSRYARPQGVRAAPARRPARPARRLRRSGNRRARRRGAADARAPRRRVRLPGRGARPAPRSRTCPTTRCRTPAGSTPGTPIAAATAAGSRFRGPGQAPPFGFSPGRRERPAVAAAAGSLARADRRGADRRSSARCSSSTGTRFRSAARAGARRRHAAVARRARRCAGVRPRPRIRVHRQPRRDPVPAPPGADLLLSSGELEPGGEIPPDTAAWFTTATSA